MRNYPVEATYGVSPLQAGLLFHTLQNRTSGLFVTQFSCRLDRLDVSLFSAACATMVARHPVLRTAFSTSNAGPRQIVFREAATPIQEHDWRGLPPDQQAARFRQLRQDERGEGFALDRPPLFRIALARLDSDSYQLLWSHHHIILDGWSMARLWSELLTIYEALARGISPQLPPARPFREFIEWLDRQDSRAAEAYWRSQFDDFTSAAVVQANRHGTSSADTAFAHHTMSVSREESAEIRAASRERRVTLGTVLHGAWAVLVGRLTGSNEVCFGSVRSGRSPDLPGVESMVGLLANTLPLRVTVRPEMTTAAWLQHLQQQMGQVLPYEHCALVDIHRWAGIPAGKRMFDSLLAVENVPRRPPTAVFPSGLRIGSFDIVEQTNYPLTVTCIPGERLAVTITGLTAHVSGQTVESLADSFTTIVRALVGDGARRIAALPSTHTTEQRQTIERWSRGPRVEQACSSVAEQVAEHAARTPDAIALAADGGRHLTYAGLEAAATRLAQALRRSGVGPETVVGVYGERSIDLVVALYGVLKAGGAYLPLEPNVPWERLRWIVTDAGARVVVPLQAAAGEWPTGVVAVPVTGTAGDSVDGPSVCCAPAQAVYVLYTSGSTGTPKGVVITNEALTNYIAWSRATYDVHPGSRVPLHSPIGFDLTITSLWTPLTAGATVTLIREPVLERLASALAIDGPWTLAKLTPTHLDALAQLGGTTASGPTLVVGGEALWGGQLDPWRRADAGERVINEYGPTETTVGCAVYEVPPGSPPEGAIAIGTPVANTDVYVLDDQGELTAPGVVGELFVGGIQVARGYVRDASRTASKFVPDPYGPPGSRLYRTGDLVRWSADGVLEYVGRCDRQVKIHGFRVEPAEVEAVLRRHEHVQAAAVRAERPEEHPQGVRLVAYVVPRAGHDLTIQAVQAHVRARLPAYLVPRVVTFLAALPQTSNGKINWKALPTPDVAAPALATSFAAPETEAEGALAEIVQKVLGAARVGLHDDFFALGGDSISALMLVARILEVFDVELPLQDVFMHRTIQRLTMAILQKQAESVPAEELEQILASLESEPMSAGEHR